MDLEVQSSKKVSDSAGKKSDFVIMSIITAAVIIIFTFNHFSRWCKHNFVATSPFSLSFEIKKVLELR